jgi:hypothetical protein
MYALVMGICLNTSILCTMDVADQRQYMLFHDEQFHDADICEKLQKYINIPPPPFIYTDRAAARGYYAYAPADPMCVKDFIPRPAPADREIPNNMELVPGNLDQARQILKQRFISGGNRNENHDLPSYIPPQTNR